MISYNKRNIDLINSITQLLFRRIPISDILTNKIFFDDIGYQTLADYMNREPELNKHYSDLECERIAEAINDYVCDRDELRMRVSRRGVFHVFDVMAELLTVLLTQDQDTICCRYAELMRWRQLTSAIGEELPVTLMYVLTDMYHGQFMRNNFTWDFVAPQNNTHLNRILEQGISEHHFHLWGSAPHFQVSWLNLMNYIIDSSYTKGLARIDLERQILSRDSFITKMINQPYEMNNISMQKNSSLVILHLQAALIRGYLCAQLKKISFFQTADNDNIDKNNVQYIQYLLQNPSILMMEASEIQSSISALQTIHCDSCVDYAIQLSPGSHSIGQEEYRIFSGERWFMYSMLNDIFLTYPKLTREEHNLFYAYLCIQVELRSQMVQNNNKLGFDNFQRYERRKGLFLGDAQSTKLIAQLAVREPLKSNPHLIELEARIGPGNSAEENQKRILELEDAILEEEDEDYQRLYGQQGTCGLKERYYYVFHFLKKEDIGLRKIPKHVSSHQIAGYATEYRHYAYRNNIEKQARAIVGFREQYSELADRVKGIDACSQEIGCRPENFASVFRLLGKHSCQIEDFGHQRPMCRLRKTYHVGEDFLDITDGLRAIDEAVKFLNLDCGDRLGHATVLGINVEDWYHSKNYQVTLSVQDYLDNLAWLYHAIYRYEIKGMELLLNYLKEQFDIYFRSIYLNYMNQEDQDTIMKAALEHYGAEEDKRDYKFHKCLFGIEEYYLAWTLRGDHPALYKSGFYHSSSVPIDDWDRSMTNSQYPKRFNIRYIPECSMIYYYYHYNIDIKREGARNITTDIHGSYIQGVKAVQKAMQFEISRRGLSIETNPTSNALISTFRQYDKHPIVALFNKGLVHFPEELHNCPQISVSINTDDKGVFFTDLENEYALMASALESVLDENGEPVYRPSDIYDWINNIRQMSNLQGFA